LLAEEEANDEFYANMETDDWIRNSLPVPYGKEMELTTHSISRIRPNHSLINTFTVGD